MKHSISILTLFVSLGLTACGGGSLSLVDLSNGKHTPEVLPITDPTDRSDLGTKIMDDVYSVTVNKSLVTLAEESGNKFLQLRSLGGTSSAGGFYGGGVGNKAFIGFGGTSLAGSLVSDFQSIEFKTRELASNPSGSYNVYLNLLIDLNCNVNNPDYAVVVSDLTTTPGAKGNWYSFAIHASDPAFKSVGGKGALPSHLGSTYASMSTLSAVYPLACFTAADVFDNGMKRDQKLSPFLLIHGDSGYSTASAVQIDDVQIKTGTQTLSFGF